MPEQDQLDPQTIEAALGWDSAPDEGGDEDEAAAPEPKQVDATPALRTVAAPKVLDVSPPPDATLEQAQYEARSSQVKGAIIQAAVEYREELIRQGADPEAAHERAEARGAAYWAEFQKHEVLNTAGRQAKRTLIKELSAEHGIAPGLLEGFNDIPSMTAAARAYGVNAKELADLRAKVTGKAPVQSFDRGGGASGNSRSAKQLAYISGKGGAMTTAEYEVIFGYNPL